MGMAEMVKGRKYGSGAPSRAERRRLDCVQERKTGPPRLISLLTASLPTPMDTQDSPTPAHDTRPQDQQERAAAARPNPNDPAVEASSPTYGEFGGVSASPPLAASHAPVAVPEASIPAGRDGSNDNPDEFSELHGREKEAQRAPANPAEQPGHVEQNQNPAAVRATHDESNEEQRNAWALDDPRYAGGGTHNTRKESASTKDGQD